MLRGMKHAPFVLAVIGVLSGIAPALEFARPFGDHMVLPHGVACPVWGTAAPDAEVRVDFAGQSRRTRADAGGRWRVVLAPVAAEAAGRVLTASSGGERAILTDVLAGEVWLCSGQSNMDFPLAKAVGGKAEAAKAGGFSGIRLYNLTGVTTADRPFTPAERERLTPKRHFTGAWQVADETHAAAISAVAWWTARAVYEAKRIPIGIVENAVGGSGAEAWLPRKTLESRQEYRGLLDGGWLDSPQVGAWARGRARRNLAGHPQACHPYQPGFLYESGVRWWRGFPFAGVLWYQGETNAEVPDDPWNQRLIEDLVTGWRSGLERRNLPFFMVQLPRIGGSDPLRQHWPAFRAVQARAAARMTGVRLVVTEDLGWDSPDVHPPDKLPVAKRLAAAILTLR